MNFIKDIFRGSTEKQSLGYKFRQKRMEYFCNLLQNIKTPIKILDLGGTEDLWEQIDFHNNSKYDITLLNLTYNEVSYSNIKSVVGDATNLKQYHENEFDLIFSNSVIEHLYTKTNQLKMSSEILRVGKYHYCQTPNKHFLVEPHYILPFMQFLPKKLQYNILTKTRLSRLKKWDEEFALKYTSEIRLITYKEMQNFFPHSTIWKEKIFIFSKSFVAHNL